MGAAPFVVFEGCAGEDLCSAPGLLYNLALCFSRSVILCGDTTDAEICIFITTSCYCRKPFLGTAKSRDVFLSIFEQVRQKYRFQVVGFVVLPEHVHLLVGEPEKANPSVVMQVLKQRVARRLLRTRRRRNRDQMELWGNSQVRQRFWQRRSYDFNIFSERKMTCIEIQ